MTSEPRTRGQRIQAGLDSAWTESQGCDLAMLADVRTGLVLRRAGSSALKQEVYDRAAATAGRLVAGPLTRAMAAGGRAGTVLESILFRQGGDIVVLHDAAEPDEAMVCRFGGPSDRSKVRAVFAQVMLESAATAQDGAA